MPQLFPENYENWSKTQFVAQLLPASGVLNYTR